MHGLCGSLLGPVTFVRIFYIFSAILLKQCLHNLQGKLLTPKIHIVTSDIHTIHKNCHFKHYTLRISFKFQHQVYHFMKKLMSDSQLGHVGCCLILMYGIPFARSNWQVNFCFFTKFTLQSCQPHITKLPTTHCQLAKCTKLLEMLFKLCRIRILQAAHLPNG